MMAADMLPDEQKARRRRNFWLAWVHVALAAAIVAGFVWSVTHPR